MLTEDPVGWRELRFGDVFEKPAYELRVNPDGELEVTFAGDVSELPSITEQLELAESLAIAPNCQVPYGYIEDGVVTTLLFCGGLDEDETLGYVRYLFGLDSYVLEGYRLPNELHSLPGSLGKPWFERFWRLVEEGRVVRLSDRLNNLPGEVWSIIDTTGLAILLDAVDDKLPTLVAGMPYRVWHISEREPQERFSDPRGPVGYFQKCRGWFN